MQTLTILATKAAPFIANHLWQSTIFAVVAGLLTLTLRKNHASIRYTLWLAASLKFLLPFSLLTALGSRLASTHATVQSPSYLYVAVEQASQPFTQQASALSEPVHQLTLLPMILALTWLCGLITIIGCWAIRWSRVAASMHTATPVTLGRELEALRRLEQITSARKPLPLVLSHVSMEPGIFGILRPVLIWPADISAHLDDAHLEAILAHELCHVRRRDNLVAALHMLIEAVFWFHPLVWWIGSRLLEERESACDEAVLRMDNEPEIYAESILRACKFSVESPLSCVSGVTGSNLKQRIVHIMTQSLTAKLTLGKKLLLAACAVAAVAIPIGFGVLTVPSAGAQTQATTSIVTMVRHEIPSAEQTQSADPSPASYQVATFRQNTVDGKMSRMEFLPGGGFTATNVTVRHLIEAAYNAKPQQLSGGPAWIDTDRYDIEVHPTGGGPHGLPMRTLQSVLSERFNLKLSEQSQLRPGYALIVATTGAKLTPTPEPQPTVDINGKRETVISSRSLVKNGIGQIMLTGSLQNFADQLSGPLGSQVVDKTGLNGSYTIDLHWTEANGHTPDLVSAVQDQLGLTLEPIQAPVNVFVIDNIDQPAA